MATLSATTPDTKSCLLDAAERLFAERGIAGASLRAITREAGANLAAVHYHFGSKEGLVRSVLARRLEPLNRERLRRLDRLDDRERPNVQAIVEAFVAPPLRMIETEPGGRAFAQLVARSFLEPAGGTRELVLEQFGEVIERFTAMLARAQPALPPEEVYWRFHFMAGCLSFTAGLGFLVQRYAGVPVAADGPEPVIRQLVQFLTGGMRQPPAPTRGGR